MQLPLTDKGNGRVGPLSEVRLQLRGSNSIHIGVDLHFVEQITSFRNLFGYVASAKQQREYDGKEIFLHLLILIFGFGEPKVKEITERFGLFSHHHTRSLGSGIPAVETFICPVVST